MSERVERFREIFREQHTTNAQAYRNACRLFGALIGHDPLSPDVHVDRQAAADLVANHLAWFLPAEATEEDVLELVRPSIEGMDCRPEGVDHWLAAVASTWHRVRGELAAADRERQASTVWSTWACRLQHAISTNNATEIARDLQEAEARLADLRRELDQCGILASATPVSRGRSSGQGAAGGTNGMGPRAYDDALGEVRARAEALNEALLAFDTVMIKANSQGAGAEGLAWVEFCKSPSSQETAGAGFHLMQFGAQLYNKVMSTVMGTIVREAPLRIDACAEAVSSGMAKAALGCACGRCQYCMLKSSRGLKLAMVEVKRAMQQAVRVTRGAPAGRA